VTKPGWRNPPANGIKFFATADLLESVKDRGWLVRMSSTIYQHWHKKNARQKEFAANGHTTDLNLQLTE